MSDVLDRAWMAAALDLADRAAAEGEVPVGALIVRHGVVLGIGWNQPIGRHDPSAHAEVLALRDASRRVRNYRLPGTTIYATLEPCAMCAGAIVLARVQRVVFAAADPRAGAAGSVLDVFGTPSLNHRPACIGGVLAEEAGHRLREFFRTRRAGRVSIPPLDGG